MNNTLSSDKGTNSYTTIRTWVIFLLAISPLLEVHYELIWKDKTIIMILEEITNLDFYGILKDYLLLPVIALSLWLCSKKYVFAYALYGFVFFFNFKEQFISQDQLLKLEGFASTELLLLFGSLYVYFYELTSKVLKSVNHHILFDEYIHKSPNILVVDDDSDARAYYKRMFKEYGMNVYLAKNRRDAIEQIQKHQFDCILMDFFLHEDTGNEIAKALRGNPRTLNTPIIGISSNAIDEKYKNFFYNFISKRQPIEKTLEIVKKSIPTGHFTGSL